MKHKILILAALLPALCAAKQLTPAQALQRAASASPVMAKAPAKAGQAMPQPAYTASAAEGNALYVFNAPGGDGFVVVSADDCAAPLLGYAEAGAFDPASASPELMWWLGQYQEQIAAGIASGSTMAPAPSRRANIAPMIATQWNQAGPYNNLCPVDTQTGEISVTGCVATSLAQVMNYHQWPASASVSGLTYYMARTGEEFGCAINTAYDWDAMLDTYSASSPASSCQAVAELMRDCGYAVSMSYSSIESGAFSIELRRALIHHFGYDKGVEYVERAYYRYDEWEGLIYGEMLAGRPVIYNGTSSAGGHSFVCDGYADGYFHINWGWGGQSNGYFLLCALDPGIQGIGGGSGAFCYNQAAVIGIQRPAGTAIETPRMHISGDLATAQPSYPARGNVVIAPANHANPGLYSDHCHEINVIPALRLVDEQGAELLEYSPSYGTLSEGYGWKSYQVRFGDVPAGRYTVTPVFLVLNDQMETEGVYDVDMDWTCVTELELVATDALLVFRQKPAPSGEVAASGLALHTPMDILRPFSASATISATVEAQGDASLVLIDSQGRKRLFTDEENLTILPCKPVQYAFAGNFTMYDTDYGMPEAGDYKLAVMFNDKVVSDLLPVTVMSGSDSDGQLTMSVLNAATATKDEVRMRISVNCTDGFMSNLYTLGFYDTDLGIVKTFKSPVVCAMAGESRDYDFSTTFYEGVAGKTYYVAYLSGGWMVDPSRAFVLGDAAPVEVADNTLTYDYRQRAAVDQDNYAVLQPDGSWAAKSVKIFDGLRFSAPYDIAAEKIEYRRQFPHAEWQALCLPYDMQYADWKDKAVVGRLSGISYDGSTVKLKWETVENEPLEAGMPYIIRPLAAGDVVFESRGSAISQTYDGDKCVEISDGAASVKVVASFEAKEDMADCHAYALSGGTFYYTTSNEKTLKPMRIHLLLTLPDKKAPMKIQNFVDDTPAGIWDIEVDCQADGAAYDLLGRPDAGQAPGLRIVNGHKELR